MRSAALAITFWGAFFLLLQHSLAEEGAVPAPEQAQQAGQGEEIEEVSEVRAPAGSGGWSPGNFPVLERVTNLLTPTPARRRSLLLTIDHRPYERFTRETFRDFFGFDAGNLKIGLALRYGLLDSLDVGLTRLNGTTEIFDVYQLDARWRLLEQSFAFLDVAVRGGVTWFYQPAQEDAVGYLAELMLARAFLGRIRVGTGLLFHSSSSGADKANQDDSASLAVTAWIGLRLLSSLRWSFELSAPVVGYAESYPAMTTALKFLTYRHAFSLLVSNTQHITADGLAAGSGRDLGELVLGFTILREFDL